MIDYEEAKEKIINQLYAAIESAEEAESAEHKHRQLEIWADWIFGCILGKWAVIPLEMIREAREALLAPKQSDLCPYFLDSDEKECVAYMAEVNPYCRLCKLLTEAARGKENTNGANAKPT